MSIITVTIPNWSKFNPRSDRANFTWFRFENDFFHDERIFALNPQQVIVYLFLLCQASKKNKETVQISLEYASAILKLKKQEIENNIQWLHNAGLMTAESRHDDGESPGVIPATRRDERDERDERTILPTSSEFESLYRIFPRKEGKQKGLASCKAQIKTREDFELLQGAINRYIKYCAKNSVEPRFVKHFSTFMNSWRDWLDPDTGTFEKPKTEEPEWIRLEREKERRGREQDDI